MILTNLIKVIFIFNFLKLKSEEGLFF